MLAHSCVCNGDKLAVVSQASSFVRQSELVRTDDLVQHVVGTRYGIVCSQLGRMHTVQCMLMYGVAFKTI